MIDQKYLDYAMKLEDDYREMTKLLLNSEKAREYEKMMRKEATDLLRSTQRELLEARKLLNGPEVPVVEARALEIVRLGGLVYAILDTRERLLILEETLKEHSRNS